MKNRIYAGFAGLTVAAAGFAAAPVAEASSVVPLIDKAGGQTIFIDKDANYHIGEDSTNIQVGDVLRGHMEINIISSANTGGEDTDIGNTTYRELTAVYQIKVIDIVAGDGPGLWDVSFGADPDFGLSPTSGEFGGGSSDPTGAMVVFFEDDARNFNWIGAGLATDGGTGRTDPEESIATSYDGNRFITYGMTGSYDAGLDVVMPADENELWVAQNATRNLEALRLVAADDSVGDAYFSLNRIEADESEVLDGLPSVAFTRLFAALGIQVTSHFSGSTPIQGTQGAHVDNTGFHTTSDARMRAVFVPTPSAALPGLMLLGALGLVRPKNRMA